MPFVAALRKRFQDQGETLRKEKAEVEESLVELRGALYPVLRVADPGVIAGSDSGALLKCPREVPGKVEAWVRRAAVRRGQQVLATLRSHYPRIEAQRAREGFAADTGDDQVRELLAEALSVAEFLAGRVRL